MASEKTQNRRSEDAWNKGIAALLAFKGRVGHCAVPRQHREHGYRLGQWVAVQRYNRANLASTRKAQLDHVGFLWSQQNEWWEEAFAALRAFKAREGHCYVHKDHVEGGVHLGYWVIVQRRTRNKMNRVRKRRLDKVGFSWSGIRARADKPKLSAPQSKSHSCRVQKAAAT